MKTLANFGLRLRNFKFRLAKYASSRWGRPYALNEEISKVYIRRFLPPQPTIVDCGANDGEDTVELARTFKGKVYAFEPVPNLFEGLVEKTRDYPSIECFATALGDRTGHVDFHISEGASEASSSVLPPKAHLTDYPDVHFKKKIQVPITTLDAWAAANGIDRIDFLWLDMQGFEMQMLEASPRILATATAIHTEVNLVEAYSGAKLYPEFRKWLASKGFVVQWEAIPPSRSQGNVLFVRKK